jgi:hypothetical protein
MVNLPGGGYSSVVLQKEMDTEKEGVNVARITWQPCKEKPLF